MTYVIEAQVNNRMKKIGFLILPLALSISVAANEKKTQYFYSLPEEASSEWAYQLPDCSILKSNSKDSLIRCSPIGDHKMCATKEFVELTNSLTKEKKKFPLVYHVFKSKDKCKTDRDSELEGD